MEEIACAICGARDTRRLYTKFGHGIERCTRCGLVYANPRAPEEAILARYSPDYFWHEYLPAIGAPEGRVDLDFVDRRYRPMLSLLRRHAPQGRRLLEVGTGAGMFLKAAERAGWEVAGLELSEEGAAFARDRLGLDVRQERAETMSFPAESFDVAVLFDVIEHLFDPRRVLESTRRALKPGGLIVISTPNLNALTRQALGVDWAVLSPLEHLYYFTAETLPRMLAAAGFASARMERCFEGWGRSETMNYRYTHARRLRTRVYAALVNLAPGIAVRAVQRLGKADALICVGRVS